MLNIGGYTDNIYAQKNDDSLNYSCDSTDSVNKNYHTCISQSSFEYRSEFELPIERSEYYPPEKSLYENVSSHFSLDTVSQGEVHENHNGYDSETSSVTSSGSIRELNEVYCSSEDEIRDMILNENEVTEKSLSDEGVANITQECNNKKRKYLQKENLTRKRQRNPEKWQRNVIKAAVNAGLEYKSATTNKYVPARIMQRTCGPGCRFKCEQKIKEEDRKKFFEQFWSIQDHSKKYDFIIRYVTEKSSLEKGNDDVENKRNYTRTYSISSRTEDIVVCKTMFLNTLDISKRMVTTVLGKLRKGEQCLTDKRGKFKNQPNTLNEEKTASVKEHINLFPRVPSHYTRKDSSREYLEENLSLSIMYNLYTEWAKENDKNVATKHYYSDIFNNNFNIGFFKPKKDQCDVCEGYTNATNEDKVQLENTYKFHCVNKEKSRQLKDDDKKEASKNPQTSVICFDFQKILSTPKTEASCLYYKRKLSVYNFTIYDVVRHEGFCYVWTENDAKKGANEVSSCLLHYIQKKVEDGVNNFSLWSDNCGGQNRNTIVFAMLVYASAKYNITIRHNFLESGHTQNEGDAVHAAIERHAKGRKIYTPDEWCEIIRGAKIKNPKYEVIRVSYGMIYDFKQLSLNLNWNKVIIKKGRKSSEAIGVSKWKQVMVVSGSENQLKYKKAYEDNYETLITRIDKNHVNVKKYTLKKAYTAVQGIKKAKIKDLQTLCKKNIIPAQFHVYYNLFNENDHESDEKED